MGNSTLRPIFLLLLALWLPLQSALAFAMPFCGHARHEGQVVAQARGDAAADAGHHAHHPGAEESSARHRASDSAGGCDQCGLCHLACAGFVAPASRQPEALAPGHVLTGARQPSATNPPRDPLDRPPLSAA